MALALVWMALVSCAGSVRSAEVDTLPLPPAEPATVAATEPAALDLRCVGAASMDPENPCVNPALSGPVRSEYAAAVLAGAPRCSVKPAAPTTPPVCSFGVPAAKANGGTVALIGDSHAITWRVALEAVSASRRWTGLSRARPGCLYSTVVLASPRSICGRTVSSTGAWLAAKPRISTVFVASSAIAHAEVSFDDRVIAAGSALAALPASVRHVVVLRDNPVERPGTQACVARASAQLRAPGLDCALLPTAALKPDPLVTAALGMRSSRYTVLDLSAFMCGARVCRPVIGGLAVHRDGDHLSDAFTLTLGPYLQRTLERQMAGWR